jgi:hypothetical protein
MTTWTPGRQPKQCPRALPIPVSLVHGEDSGSLLHRLAIANHIHPTDLREAIGAGTGRRVPVELLAGLLGQPPDLLRRIVHDDWHHQLATQRAACTRCLARLGITEPVTVIRPIEQPLCRRHRRWLPEHAYDQQHLDEYQVDLLRLPEILSSQRRHARLARRYGRTGEFGDASASANYIVSRWAERRDFGQQRHRRLNLYIDLREWRVDATNPLAIMARYPDVVTLTGLLADPAWTQLALSHKTGDVNRFHDEIRRRLKIPYEPYTAFDPLVRWRATEPIYRAAQAELAKWRADPPLTTIRNHQPAGNTPPKTANSTGTTRSPKSH